MEHAFSRITAILTAVLMFFMVPLMIHIQRQESLVQLSVMQDTVQFVDSVRNMGRMTPRMYEEYQHKIRRMQDGLEVYMVHTVNSIHMGGEGVEQTLKIRTEADIIECLESRSEYLFQKGDYFRVEVRRKTPGLLERLYGAFSIEQVNPAAYVYYGGSIRYEGK